MNNSARITRRALRPARGTHLLRIGAAALLAAGLLSAVLAVGAQTLPPHRPDGVVVHACPDAYEVDDEPTNAGTLNAGASQPRNFDGNTNLGVADKDWVRFQVVRTGVYTLTTSNLSAQTDTVIALHDANGSLVMENDNSGGGPGSQIVWSAPETASGWYYVSVYPTGTTPYADCAGTVITVVSYTLSMNSKVPMFVLAPLIMRNIP